MMKNIKKFSFLLLIVCLIFDCSEARKKKRLKEEIALISSELSYINIPISYPYSVLENVLNKKLTKFIYKDESFEDDGLSLLVKKSGRIKMQRDSTAQKLIIMVPIAVSASKKVKNLIGKEKIRDIDFKANIWLSTPINIKNDWTIETKCTIDKVVWVEKPSLQLGPFQIGIANKLEKDLTDRDSKLPGQIDAALGQNVKLDTQVANTWHSLHKPILLSKQEPKIWLNPVPKRVEITPLYLTPFEVSTLVKCVFSLEASPKKSRHIHYTDLPQFTYKTDTTTGYILKVLYQMTHVEISKSLSKVLKGSTFDLAGNTVSVEDVMTSVEDDQFVITLGLKGDLEGSIKMSGTPSLNTKSKELSFTDVDFELESDHTLANAADFVLHDYLKNTLAEKAKIEFGPFTKIEPHLIENAIQNSKAGEKIMIETSTMILEAEDWKITQEGIQVLINAKGSVKLQVKKKAQPTRS